MQKYRFFLGIIIVISITFSFLKAQNPDIYQLYTSGQFHAIEKELTAQNISDEKWRKFAEILFIENLDKALEEYISLYNSYENVQLRNLIIDRISQYYYARGLYESADRILKDEEFRQKVFAVNTRKISFGVQLGAFSTYDNANAAKNKYSADVDDIIIINKDSGGKQLYVVVAGRYDSREKAENRHKLIRNKLGIKGIIIQY